MGSEIPDRAGLPIRLPGKSAGKSGLSGNRPIHPPENGGRHQLWPGVGMGREKLCGKRTGGRLLQRVRQGSPANGKNRDLRKSPRPQKAEGSLWQSHLCHGNGPLHSGLPGLEPSSGIFLRRQYDEQYGQGVHSAGLETGARRRHGPVLHHEPVGQPLGPYQPAASLRRRPAYGQRVQSERYCRTEKRRESGRAGSHQARRQ